MNDELINPDLISGTPRTSTDPHVAETGLISIDPLDQNSGSEETFELRADDRAYFDEVARKYAPMMSDQSLSLERRAQLNSLILQEIKARARRTGATVPGSVPVVPRTSVPAPAPVNKTSEQTMSHTKVKFEFGPLGSHTAEYDHVQLTGRCLLLAKSIASAGGVYTPPEDRKMVVIVDGMPYPLVVVLLTLMPFNGYNQILMITTDDEE